MIGLAKCLILSGDNEYTLSYKESINRNHRHHGLSFAANNQTEKTIRDGNRLLKEFCRVISNDSKIGLYNLFRQCYSNTQLPNNFKISVETLLSLVPELHNDFYTQIKKKPRCWGCYGHYKIKKLGSSDQLIEFKDYYYHFQKQKGEKYPTTIKRCFPILSSRYKQVKNSEDKFLLKGEAKSIDDCIYISDLLTLNKYALMQVDGYTFSDLDVHFLLMFILSNLVRYKQGKWANLIQRKCNNDIFLIDSFINISATKFPWLILKELDNYDYTFIGQVATYG